MTLKTKLSLGLGFLFLIIFTLAVFCSFYVEKMAAEAGDILKDNYNSLEYSKNMIAALDDMRTAINRFMITPNVGGVKPEYYWDAFESENAKFASNAKAENNNITEIQEKEYVATLNHDYDLFMQICLQINKGLRGDAAYFDYFMPAYEKLKKTVNAIYDINMQAVVRKYQLSKHDSGQFITYMAGIGFFCIILALGYFWYFPFYTSNSMEYLAKRMMQVMNNAGIICDPSSKDELIILLHAINELENVLANKNSSADGQTSG